MNPDDVDAKHNLELALKRSSPPNRDEVQEQEEQQEDQEQEEQQQEEQQEDQEQEEQQQEEQREDQEQEEQQQEEQREDQEQEEQQQDQPLTVEQARHILESVGESAQTFQQKRGQVLVSPKPPSEFDW